MIECGACHFKIRFKADIKSSCRSCSEMYDYCSERKAFTIGITILLLAIIICVIIGVLALLNVMPGL